MAKQTKKLKNTDEEDSIILSALPEVEEEKPESIVLSGPTSPEDDSCEVTQKAIPGIRDPEWSQYVMGQFSDDELEGENPRLEGLRRVTECLIGEIVEEGSSLVCHPSLENQSTACAKAWIVIERCGLSPIRFEALADASPNNCSKDFAMYLTAMADTRAKGRCYRAALRLKRVIAAEEASGIKDEEGNDLEREINPGQIATIRLLADRLNVSIKSLLEDLEIPYKTINGQNFPDLKSIDHQAAMIVINRLNSLRAENHVPDKLTK